MKIPLTRRSSDAYSMQKGASPTEGTGVGNAVTNLGTTVFNISNQYLDKLNQDEARSQSTEYLAGRSARWKETENLMSTLTNGEDVNNVYEQFKRNEQKELSDGKFNPAATKTIELNNHSFDAESNLRVNGISGLRNEARNKGIDNNNYVILDSATMAEPMDEDAASFYVDVDNMEYPDDINRSVYSAVIDDFVERGRMDVKTATEKKSSFGSTRIYNATQNSLALLKEGYASGEFSGDAYIESLGQLRNEIRDRDDIKFNHSKPLDTMITGMISNTKTREGSEATKAIKSAKAKLVNGTLDSMDFNNAEKYFDKDTKDLFMSSIETEFRAEASGESDSAEMIDDLLGVKKGLVPLGEFSGKYKSKKGRLAETAFILAAEYMEQAAASDGKVGYEVFKQNKTISVTNPYDSILETISAHAKVMDPNAREKWVNDAVRSIDNMQTKIPNPTDAQLAEYSNQLTAGNAKEIIHGLTSRFTGRRYGEAEAFSAIKNATNEDEGGSAIKADGTNAAVPTSRNKDSYEVGDTVTGTDGIKYKKLENGQWEEL